MPRQREIVVEFIRERNVFQDGEPGDDDYKRTIIATVKDGDGKEATIKGEAEEGDLVAGVPYRFYGHVHNHHRWGPQFLFSSFVTEQPATEKGIVAYLSQLTGNRIGVKRGIGKGTAYLLWEEYGPKAVETLRNDPLAAAKAIPKLNKETATAAAKWLATNQHIERAQIDLNELLDGRGFPQKTSKSAIQKYGSKAADCIRRNPYLLMSFRGCGFKLCDKMYLDLGNPAAKLKRQSLCGWYTLASDKGGHTWFLRQHVEKGIRTSVGSANVNCDRAIELALRAKLLAEKIDDRGVSWLAEYHKAKDEERLARYVKDALLEHEDWPEIEQLCPDEMTEHQTHESKIAMRSVIGILAGGPGTGKTHCAAKIVGELIKSQGKGMVAVVAPTGKAAVRITESMQESGLGISARSIHSLLGTLSLENGGQFKHHEGNPLDYRFVIIDESSMIDTSLMASLFAARARGTHYLFIGDHRQLAPIGHGCPFADFQVAGVPTGELTEVRRNSGAIVKACADIRDSNSFNVCEKINEDTGDNLICTGQGSSQFQIETLENLLSAIGRSGDLSQIWDVQVVVAVNKKSDLSRVALNLHLQGVLNPTGHQVRGNPFRVGDKIINLKNGMFPSLDGVGENEDGNVYVANGEQAEVVEIESYRTIARLESPDRLIVIPHGQQRKSDGENHEGSAGTWDLAYAISVHKSQGSEWPIVVVMIDEHQGAKFLCTRNWIYTAISRGKRACVMIGSKTTAMQMVKRNGLKRKTMLAQLIKEDAGVPTIKIHVPEPEISLSESEFKELFASV